MTLENGKKRDQFPPLNLTITRALTQRHDKREDTLEIPYLPARGQPFLH